jgi:hypothetical protein
MNKKAIFYFFTFSVLILIFVLSLSNTRTPLPQFKIEAADRLGAHIHYQFPEGNSGDYYGIKVSNDDTIIAERFTAIDNVFYGTRGGVFLKNELEKEFPILLANESNPGNFIVNFGNEKDNVQQLHFGKLLTKEITKEYKKAIPSD